VKVRFLVRFGAAIPVHEAIKTTSAPLPRGAYSQAVRVGSYLFISGQLPIDREGNVVKGTMAQEATQSLENMRAIVEAAEGTIADIVQCTIYISDIAQWTEVDGIYGAFFSEVPVLPARTVVPVKEMHFGARIEIQAIAFLNRA
jgi:2-iminobutanoate/2-iminopropanoate deaminase